MKSPFSHIVVPVDGSAPSDRGVRFAIELLAPGGTITFCSAYDITAACLPAAQGAAIDPGPMIEALEENAELFCGSAVAVARAAGVRATSEVLQGGAGPAIAAFAERIGADAIVVGTHGRTGLARAMLGSIAEGFLRGADVPVIVVHDDDAVEDGPIAVAVDGSPPSRYAVDVALALARASHAELAFIHVSEALFPGEKAPGLDDAAERARAEGIAFTEIAREGAAAAAEIIAAAGALRCSAIVTGTHGRAAVPRFFLGSVANALVEQARVPVVAVRTPLRSAAPSTAAEAPVPAAAP
ncbi:MAG TPA: universal stress protein [Candidatus Baltobacteraceae bacterium]|nr:universal stress protein [Candidatus Baltobacteraceae bacterium]